MYPDLNLEPLFGGEKYAVHCSTIEEAKHFVNQIKKQYPENARGWSYGETHWSDSRDICYAPYLNEGGTLVWCDRDYYEENNFKIFEFTDLLPEGDIDEGDQPVDILFGGTYEITD